MSNSSNEFLIQNDASRFTRVGCAIGMHILHLIWESQYFSETQKMDTKLH